MFVNHSRFPYQEGASSSTSSPSRDTLESKIADLEARVLQLERRPLLESRLFALETSFLQINRWAVCIWFCLLSLLMPSIFL